MYSLDDFIRANDSDNIVKKAIADCIIENMTKEIAIDILAQDLSKRLEDYLFDDGSNVLRDFNRDINDILTEYFGK